MVIIQKICEIGEGTPVKSIMVGVDRAVEWLFLSSIDSVHVQPKPITVLWVGSCLSCKFKAQLVSSGFQCLQFNNIKSIHIAVVRIPQYNM